MKDATMLNNEYINLSDMANNANTLNGDYRYLLAEWMAHEGTLKFLIEFEAKHNQKFKDAEFIVVKRYRPTTSNWIKNSGTKFMYWHHGTYAHREIALNFAKYLLNTPQLPSSHPHHLTKGN